MSTYPKSVGFPAQLIWACCESSIGPVCNHLEVRDWRDYA